MGSTFVGTSGWNYDHWRDSFYVGVSRQQWLQSCAEQFTGIEVNATFYRLQDQKTFRHWAKVTPDGFRFAIKANRYLTHNKKLNDAPPAVRKERSRARALGNKLTAVLWQLPGNFKKNTARLQNFLEALSHWPEARHAIEFRHASWFDDEVADYLQRHRIAACQSDAADWPFWDIVTTDLVYIRLHGHTRTYASRYSGKALDSWAEKVRTWSTTGHEVHVYFDNDEKGAAPRDALRLMRRLGLAGARSTSETKK